MKLGIITCAALAITGSASQQSVYQRGFADGQKYLQEKRSDVSAQVGNFEDSISSEMKTKMSEYEARMEKYTSELAEQAKAEAAAIADQAKAELKEQASVGAEKLSHWFDEQHKALSK